MFNLMISKDKYERVPTWNWQVGQHTIDYVKTFYIIPTLTSCHWNYF